MAAKWILVADDDRLVRELWCSALTRAGHRTLAAETGHEAVEFMRMVVPDLMILDLRMPGLTGGEVLRYLHESPVLTHIPVLIVSGFPEDEGARDAVGLNIVARLRKPLSLKQLVAAVDEALTSRLAPTPHLPPPPAAP